MNCNINLLSSCWVKGQSSCHSWLVREFLRGLTTWNGIAEKGEKGYKIEQDAITKHRKGMSQYGWKPMPLRELAPFMWRARCTSLQSRTLTVSHSIIVLTSFGTVLAIIVVLSALHAQCSNISHHACSNVAHVLQRRDRKRHEPYSILWLIVHGL